jgi:hypothetical protein
VSAFVWGFGVAAFALPREGWWARQDSNLRQHRYERRVLTTELQAPESEQRSAVTLQAKPGG